MSNIQYLHQPQFLSSSELSWEYSARPDYWETASKSVALSDYEEYDEMLWQDYYSEDDPDYKYVESDTETYNTDTCDSMDTKSEC